MDARIFAIDNFCAVVFHRSANCINIFCVAWERRSEMQIDIRVSLWHQRLALCDKHLSDENNTILGRFADTTSRLELFFVEWFIDRLLCASAGFSVVGYFSVRSNTLPWSPRELSRNSKWGFSSPYRIQTELQLRIREADTGALSY